MSTATATYTYTTVDIEKVMRRFSADIVMIAQSTGAITEAKARQYAHDVEILAKKGYLERVDLTLMDGATEVRAAVYEVNKEAGDLTSSRPGGVMWPRIANAHLRIVLSHDDSYDANARAATKPQLEINWVSTDADTSHALLTRRAGRDFSSNGWALQRTDYE